MILSINAEKKQKTRFCDPELGGELVRFLEFDHFGSKPGGKLVRSLQQYEFMNGLFMRNSFTESNG